MFVITMGISIVLVFVLAFLIDISVNLRRVDGSVKKMISKYEDIHGSKKA